MQPLVQKSEVKSVSASPGMHQIAEIFIETKHAGMKTGPLNFSRGRTNNVYQRRVLIVGMTIDYYELTFILK